MKHIKTFESFSVNEEEGIFKKFFFGHEDKEAKEATIAAFYSELDKMEEENKGNENFVLNRSTLEKNAKENNYKGSLDARRSARDGKTYVIYVPGVTGMQNLAAGSTPSGRQSIG
jgi:hypothetical protein